MRKKLKSGRGNKEENRKARKMEKMKVRKMSKTSTTERERGRDKERGETSVNPKLSDFRHEQSHEQKKTDRQRVKYPTPAANNTFIQSVCPPTAAQCSAVPPFLEFTLTLNTPPPSMGTITLICAKKRRESKERKK